MIYHVLMQTKFDYCVICLLCMMFTTLHSQPITAHDLAHVGQQRMKMFVNSQHCWTT